MLIRVWQPNLRQVIRTLYRTVTEFEKWKNINLTLRAKEKVQTGSSWRENLKIKSTFYVYYTITECFFQLSTLPWSKGMKIDRDTFEIALHNTGCTLKFFWTLELRYNAALSRAKLVIFHHFTMDRKLATFFNISCSESLTFLIW